MLNENYNKDYKKQEDLIVHKVTKVDKDTTELTSELKKKEKDFEKHNKKFKPGWNTRGETSPFKGEK